MPPIPLPVGKPFPVMPASDTSFDVLRRNGESWGVIRCGGSCKDDYRRILTYNQPPLGDARPVVKLQAAALESFQAAEKALGFTIILTGSWRSCAQAKAYYASDPNRYAPPDKGAHMRGLAIDVTTAYSAWKRFRIRRALTYRGWYQARPTDESWHYSFGLSV